MSLRQSGSSPFFERRQSFRCSVSGPRRHGQLKIGNRTIPARVLDESVGGFAVEVDPPFDGKIGDTLLLEIALAWVEVRVISLHEADAAEDDPHFDGGRPPMRVGLSRVRDLDEWEAPAENRERIFAWRKVHTLWVPFIPMNRSFKSTAVTLAGLAAAAILIVWLLEHSVPLVDAMRVAAPSGDPAPGLSEKLSSIPEKPVVKQRMLETPDWVRSPQPRKSKPRQETRTGSQWWEGLWGESPQDDQPVESPATQGPAKTRNLVRPSVLLQPEIAKKLALTPEQRDALERLAEQNQANAGDEASDGTAAPGLLHEGADVLTDEQLRLLDELQARDQPSGEERSDAK